MLLFLFIALAILKGSLELTLQAREKYRYLQKAGKDAESIWLSSDDECCSFQQRIIGASFLGVWGLVILIGTIQDMIAILRDH